MITERKKNDVKRECLDLLKHELTVKRNELKQLRKEAQFNEKITSEMISSKLEGIVIFEDTIASIKKFFKL